MKGEKQCWTCIYAENRTGEPNCMNRYVRIYGADPYDCEFYDEISDSYIDDMRKVEENT